MAAAVWTIKALLDWTTDYLAKKDFESPRLEAQLLLAHVLNCAKIDLLVRYDETPTESARTAYRELIQRRIEHWPVAYLTGTKEFYSLAFEVSPAVLIPRPDTETLILEALRLLKPIPNPAILDLGTGSGCIAVTLAKHHATARLTAVDLSPDALDVAKRNATKHSVAERIRFLQGDLWNPVPVGSTFDMIVSNPPYVTPAEFASLDATVRDHEPRLALDGGPDGLAFYRRIATAGGAFLKPGGWVLVEIGSTQDSAVRSLLADAGYEVGKTLKDMADLPRVVTARRLLKD